MSYVDMSGVQENDLEIGDLPRPPISNYQRVLNSGLRPHRIFSFQEAIDHANELSQRVQRDQRVSNIIIYTLLVILLILVAVFIVLLMTGVICFC